MYYEDYAYDYPTEDMKTEFHIKLDDIIDEEVEKRLEERIEDIAYLREKQKQYDEKIAEANQKVKEANEKRFEADKARMKAESERDRTIEQCKQSVSDATQATLDEFFGDWLKERWVYYLKKERGWVYCPYCKEGEVKITLPSGDIAVTKCKVCGAQGHREYDKYEVAYIEPKYPTFIKENQGRSIAPYFIEDNWRTGLSRVAVRNVMTEKDAEAKAKQLNEENKQKVLQYFKDIKERLDKENNK